MNKILMGLTALACAVMPSVAAAEISKVGGWTIDKSATSCLMYAHFNGGSTFTVYGDNEYADDSTLTFIIQNKKWNSLVLGSGYKLEVEFDDRGAWSVDSLATKIDEDGPGLAFLRKTTTNEDGDNFLYEFAVSNAIHIRRNGSAVDNLNLSGTRDATLAMAKCLKRFGSGDPFVGDKPDLEIDKDK